MTLYKFKKLTELEQSILVWKEGAFVGQKSEGVYKVVLFQVASFYVEVYFNTEEKRYDHLRPFSSTVQLKDYLAQIDITEILNKTH